MIDGISIIGTAVALVLPLLLGGVWVYWLLGRTERWHPALVAGHGYLVGIFAITLLIRAWDLAGLELNFWGIAAVASALTACGFALLRVRPVTARVKADKTAVPGWQLTLTCILLALITWRYSTIFQELLLRPLYPWDAWMNWAPKAVIWFHYKELVPFVSGPDWLQATAESLNHKEGAGGAWRYPPSIPLIQLWGMLNAGTSDHTHIYLPWVYAPLAMGLVIFGHLRLLGASMLLSVMATYALLSVPLFNVHAALAGYADHWVAIAFSCSVIALSEWSRNRAPGYLVLAAVFAIFCTQLKVPGLIMAAIVLLCFMICYIQLTTRTLGFLLLMSLAALLLLYLYSLDITIPGIGTVIINSSKITVPYIGDFDIEFHNVSGAFFSTMLVMINWNLLWYLLPVALLWAMLSVKPVARHSIEITALLVSLAFIFFVYYFTERYLWAEDFTQVNRALLYVQPLGFFLLARLAIFWINPSSATDGAAAS